MIDWFVTPARAAVPAALLRLAVATAVCVAAAPAAADITGAGSTFVAPLYAKWGSGYRTATGKAINYQSIGSGAGVAQIVARTVDFGATDDPMLPADLARNQLVQFPAVIGSEVIIVNLPGIQTGQLNLNAPLLAAIYKGEIKRWNDPAIAALNKGVPLRPIPITPVYRSDSSGTTAVFTQYMRKATKAWTLGAGKAISWPAGSGGKGNEGVAGNVKNTLGAVGYVEFNYAYANKLTMTRLANGAGKFVAPAPAAFLAAASQADWAKAPGATVDLLNLPGATTWPIVSATYVLVPAKPAKPAQTRQVLDFFAWSFAKGGPMAAQLGYLPLPPAATKRAQVEWTKIAGVK